MTDRLFSFKIFWYLQDPFPDINKTFKQELTKEETETLKTALGPFDMDQFLEIFYEFIVTQVKNRQEFEAEDP